MLLSEKKTRVKRTRKMNALKKKNNGNNSDILLFILFFCFFLLLHQANVNETREERNEKEKIAHEKKGKEKGKSLYIHT